MQNTAAAKKFTARHLTARVLTDVLAQHPGFSVLTGPTSKGYATISMFSDDRRCISSEERDACYALGAALKTALSGFGNLHVDVRGHSISLDFSGITLSPSRVNNCD
jgi:hypothetical protein